MKRRWMPPWYWRLRESRIWGAEAQHDIPLEWADDGAVRCLCKSRRTCVQTPAEARALDEWTPFVETWARKQRGT
jgi:hypothetical protein